MVAVKLAVAPSPNWKMLPSKLYVSPTAYLPAKSLMPSWKARWGNTRTKPNHGWVCHFGNGDPRAQNGMRKRPRNRVPVSANIFYTIGRAGLTGKLGFPLPSRQVEKEILLFWNANNTLENQDGPPGFPHGWPTTWRKPVRVSLPIASGKCLIWCQCPFFEWRMENMSCKFLILVLLVEKFLISNCNPNLQG